VPRQKLIANSGIGRANTIRHMVYRDP